MRALLQHVASYRLIRFVAASFSRQVLDGIDQKIIEATADPAPRSSTDALREVCLHCQSGLAVCPVGLLTGAVPAQLTEHADESSAAAVAASASGGGPQASSNVEFATGAAAAAAAAPAEAAPAAAPPQFRNTRRRGGRAHHRWT